MSFIGRDVAAPVLLWLYLLYDNNDQNWTHHIMDQHYRHRDSMTSINPWFALWPIGLFFFGLCQLKSHCLYLANIIFIYFSFWPVLFAPLGPNDGRHVGFYRTPVHTALSQFVPLWINVGLICYISPTNAANIYSMVSSTSRNKCSDVKLSYRRFTADKWQVLKVASLIG